MSDQPLDPAALEAFMEAVLFIAERPLATDELATLAGVAPLQVEGALANLADELESRERGIRLQHQDGAWQLATAPQLGARLAAYAAREEARLTPAALEALAIIAYRQPCTRGEVERVRGVDSDYVIRSLLHRRLIVELGRRDTPGRPVLFGTTFTFLERFGLTSTEELPPLASEAAAAVSAPGEDAAPAAAPTPMPAERLQKLLAAAGVASRRGAEELIAAGRVRVNGRVAVIGQSADPDTDRVEVDRRPVGEAEASVHYAVHKPPDMLSSSRGERGRQSVVDLVPERAHAGRLWPAGRLDADSEGLMILTNDGAWANRVLHPRYGVEREYAVLLADLPSAEEIEALLAGVELDDGVARLLSAERRPPPREVARGRGERGTWVRVRVGEGRKREVRRLFAAVGHRVRRLVRTRVGSLTLSGLRSGQWRELRPDEVASLAGTSGAMVPAAARRTSHLTIAIDGPSGSGKSTVGHAVAQAIDATFVDTGLMYRALTLAALEGDVALDDGAALGELARRVQIVVRKPRPTQIGRLETVLLNRRDVTDAVRTPRVDRAVSRVSAHAPVRDAMLSVQRAAARRGDAVMVGRDIGTVVLPDATLKVFLTASAPVRAARRAAEMGRPERVDAYLAEIERRDAADSGRAVAPLRRAPDALVLDTGELDVPGCVAAIVAALPVTPAGRRR